MARIVLPLVAAASVAADVVDAVAAADVRVAVEVVVHVYVDVIAAPTAAPAPTASAPCSAHSDANSERYGARRYNCSGPVIGRVVDRRIWIDRRAVDILRAIRRHIHNFRTGLFDDDYLFALDRPRLDCLLLV